ncbi:MAG: DUF4906 domain-containing protein [Bacteroidales bacterium]|nr:DUF4906 domain-containing protein [Bacteroidales bacterium]
MKPILPLCFLLLGCSSTLLPERCVETVIVLDADPGFRTKALTPDETRISDINLLIFNAAGQLEEKRFISARQLVTTDGKVQMSVSLLKDSPYSFYACANLGYALPVLTREGMLDYRFHLAYPDEYSRGLPMTAALEDCIVHEAGQVTLPLVRAMARIDLRIDRTALEADVQFIPRSVRIGGCPSSVRLFGESKVESADGTFTNGFTLGSGELDALNRDLSPGLSRSVSLYLLENRQGDLLEHVTTDSGKVFTDGRYGEVCSYIELWAEYQSPRWHTLPGRYLVYRFYLGESLDNFDVRRNTCYDIIVKPEGNGLTEDSWRVDKDGLEAVKRFELHPAAYNECRSGDSFHLWCDILPEETPVTIEPLAYDDDVRVADLYDYDIDTDGHGLTIHTRKGGTALVYFKAGPPVDRDTLALLVIGP